MRTAAVAAKPQTRDQQMTALQRRFADLWVQAKTDNLDITHADIAKAAGYTGTADALYVIANRTLQSPVVKPYLEQQAREILSQGRLGAAATLARLSVVAQSERVRGDNAHRLLVGTGMLAGEGSQGGGGVAIQIVFRHVDGTTLAQPAQVVDVQGVPAIDRSLVEEGAERGATTPRPRAQAKPSGGASKTSARSLKPGSTHDEAPKNSARKKSPGRKSRVKVKRSVWTDEQRAAARDRSLRLHEARRAAAGLKVGGDE